MKNSIFALGTVIGCFAISACATPSPNVQNISAIKQPGDKKLSCEQLSEEFDAMEAMLSTNKQIEGNVNTFNPAFALTLSQVSQARLDIQQRQAHLYKISEDQGC